MVWLPDSYRLALSWGEVGETYSDRIYVLDLETLTTLPISDEGWDPVIFGWTADGKWLAVRTSGLGDHFISHDGRCIVTTYDLFGVQDMTWRAFSGPSAQLLVFLEDIRGRVPASSPWGTPRVSPRHRYAIRFEKAPKRRPVAAGWGHSGVTLAQKDRFGRIGQPGQVPNFSSFLKIFSSVFQLRVLEGPPRTP